MVYAGHKKESTKITSSGGRRQHQVKEKIKIREKFIVPKLLILFTLSQIPILITKK